jgi:hypothetical protein
MRSRSGRRSGRGSARRPAGSRARGHLLPQEPGRSAPVTATRRRGAADRGLGSAAAGPAAGPGPEIRRWSHDGGQQPCRFPGPGPVLPVIEEGAAGLADGEHFYDLVAEDVVVECVITVPGYPRRVEGCQAVAELYRPYGAAFLLSRCSDLAVHQDQATGVAVLEYVSQAASSGLGPPTATATSGCCRSSTARSRPGGTTSIRWPSLTRPDGPPLNVAFGDAGEIYPGPDLQLAEDMTQMGVDGMG